ncbi:unnamed protein product [Prunus brigantina]
MRKRKNSSGLLTFAVFADSRSRQVVVFFPVSPLSLSFYVPKQLKGRIRTCPNPRSFTRQLAVNFGSLEWNWIPRSANRAAHEAARIGSGAVVQVSWSAFW